MRSRPCVVLRSVVVAQRRLSVVTPTPELGKKMGWSWIGWAATVATLGKELERAGQNLAAASRGSDGMRRLVRAKEWTMFDMNLPTPSDPCVECWIPAIAGHRSAARAD